MAIAPLVTVVIPTYNRPEFLKKTIQSVLGQSYNNLQVIIVSNGFSQQNRSVVEEIKDSRLEYYEQENSGGPSSPRNNGIKKAKGKYISFCDDDDLWMSEKTEKQVNVLENNPKVGLCYTRMVRFDESREWKVFSEGGEATFKSLLYKNVVPISSVFIRASLINNYGGFSESKRVGDAEDYEFLLRYSLKTKFYFIDEYLIKYWSGGNRTSSLDFKKSLKTPIEYLKTIFRIYYMTYKNSNTPVSNYILPALYNIKNNLKIIAYMTLKRLRLR